MANNSSIPWIARYVASKHGLTKMQSETFASLFFEVLSDGLRREKQVKIKGLGTFKVIDVKDRESVNINTGERILIEGRGKITFTPDNVMKELVNKPFSQFETVVLNDGVDFDDLAEDSEELAEDMESPAETIPATEPMEPLMEPISTYVPTETEAEQEQTVNNPAEEDASPVQEDPIAATEETVSVPEETVSVPEEAAPVPEETISIPEEAAGEPAETKVLTDEPAPLAEETPPSDEEKTKANNNTDQQKTEEKKMEENSNVGKWLIALLLTALIALGIGFYLGNRFAGKVYVPVESEESIEELQIDSAKVDSINQSDSIKKANEAHIRSKVDSITRAQEARNESIRVARLQSGQKAENAQEKPAAQTAEPAKPVQKTEPQPVAQPKGDNSPALENARRMVNSGAYIIVGTQETITVKPGQTLKSISKFYFGDGMESYIQVHNGVGDVKEGMKLRIPKIQLKKKK